MEGRGGGGGRAHGYICPSSRVRADTRKDEFMPPPKKKMQGMGLSNHSSADLTDWLARQLHSRLKIVFIELMHLHVQCRFRMTA